MFIVLEASPCDERSVGEDVMTQGVSPLNPPQAYGIYVQSSLHETAGNRSCPNTFDVLYIYVFTYNTMYNKKILKNFRNQSQPVSA